MKGRNWFDMAKWTRKIKNVTSCQKGFRPLFSRTVDTSHNNNIIVHTSTGKIGHQNRENAHTHRHHTLNRLCTYYPVHFSRRTAVPELHQSWCKLYLTKPVPREAISRPYLPSSFLSLTFQLSLFLFLSLSPSHLSTPVPNHLLLPVTASHFQGCACLQGDCFIHRSQLK